MSSADYSRWELSLVAQLIQEWMTNVILLVYTALFDLESGLAKALVALKSLRSSEPRENEQQSRIFTMQGSS